MLVPKKPLPQPEKKSAYAAAGVDIDSKMTGIQSIKEMAASTATKGYLLSSWNNLLYRGKEMMQCLFHVYNGFGRPGASHFG